MLKDQKFTFEDVELRMKALDEYKDTAEQHEFVKLAFLDSKLMPAYNDLKENFDAEHARIFCSAFDKHIKPAFKLNY